MEKWNLALMFVSVDKNRIILKSTQGYINASPISVCYILILWSLWSRFWLGLEFTSLKIYQSLLLHNWSTWRNLCLLMTGYFPLPCLLIFHSSSCNTLCHYFLISLLFFKRLSCAEIIFKRTMEMEVEMLVKISLLSGKGWKLQRLHCWYWAISRSTIIWIKYVLVLSVRLQFNFD